MHLKEEDYWAFGCSPSIDSPPIDKCCFENIIPHGLEDQLCNWRTTANAMNTLAQDGIDDDEVRTLWLVMSTVTIREVLLNPVRPSPKQVDELVVALDWQVEMLQRTHSLGVCFDKTVQEMLMFSLRQGVEMVKKNVIQLTNAHCEYVVVIAQISMKLKKNMDWLLHLWTPTTETWKRVKNRLLQAHAPSFIQEKV